MYKSVFRIRIDLDTDPGPYPAQDPGFFHGQNEKKIFFENKKKICQSQIAIEILIEDYQAHLKTIRPSAN